MGKKREQKGEALLFRDNYASGFFLFFLFLPPPAENRTEGTEQTALGSHEGKKPRRRREGKRPKPQDLPGRPLGPRTPGPPARPRRVLLILPDRNPLRGRNGCFQPISWGRGSRGGAQEQRPQQDLHPEPQEQPQRPKLRPVKEQKQDQERQKPPRDRLSISQC